MSGYRRDTHGQAAAEKTAVASCQILGISMLALSTVVSMQCHNILAEAGQAIEFFTEAEVGMHSPRSPTTTL